jgi:signal transduction histidine kinase/CheY-like chemotaxis protein
MGSVTSSAGAGLLRIHGPGLLMALFGSAVAMFLPVGATPLIGPVPPFLFAYPAVAIVALLAGPIAAIATALLCVAWGAFAWTGPGAQVLTPASATLFVLLSAGTALAVRRLRGGAVERAPPDTDGAVEPAGILAVAVMAAVLPFVVFVAIAVYSYGQAFDNAVIRAERATRIAQEHASKVLDTNEAILGRILELADGRSDAQLRASEKAVHEQLRSIAQGFRQIQSIWLFDAEGRPLASGDVHPVPFDTMSIADRDYFQWHRSNRGGLYVSEPGIGRVSQQPYFGTSRRRDDARGAFGGLASVSLSPEYFQRYYAELARTEPGLTVTLLRRDGTVLVRHPSDRPISNRSVRYSQLGEAVLSGETHGIVRALRSPFDGVTRLQAFRTIEPYPVVSTAAISHEVIVADWRRDLGLVGALLFPVSAILVTTAWFAYRRAQREARMLADLKREIASREKAEQALLQTQKLEALGLLTGSVAHDFNNILAVVTNNAHLLERTTADPASRSLAAAIRRAVSTGTRLTRQLLSFSQRQPLRPVPVDLRASLPKTFELVRTTVGRTVEVHLDVAPDIAEVEVDEAELELALINLSLNARDAMPDGGRLTVTARNVGHADDPAVPDGRTWIAIGVSDTGTGMTEPVRRRAFEPFFTTKAPGRGTGLGLAQVGAMCQQAGGLSRIDSTVGEGTTVTLLLPAAAVRGASADRAESAQPDALDCDLLLVEDNPGVSATTKALLESFGARVTHVASAQAALDACAPHPLAFDVVLSDIMMPGPMNGLALARRLRELHPRLPVLLMTGYTSELQAAVATGIEVFPKPTVPEQLVGAIDRLTKGARTSA